MRHWAYDVAKFFRLDPQTVLRTYSVGDLIEATRAMHTYVRLEQIQAQRAQTDAKKPPTRNRWT